MQTGRICLYVLLSISLLFQTATAAENEQLLEEVTVRTLFARQLSGAREWRSPDVRARFFYPALTLLTYDENQQVEWNKPPTACSRCARSL